MLLLSAILAVLRSVNGEARDETAPPEAATAAVRAAHEDAEELLQRGAPAVAVSNEPQGGN